MKNSRYGVPRTFSATTWRLLGSSAPVCGNFAEDGGEGRRRSEVTVGVDGCLRVGRGELDVDREVRGWMIQRPSVSHSRPEMTYHRPHFGSAKGGNRERDRESNKGTSHAIRNAAVTSRRHCAYKDRGSHTRISKDLETPSCSPASIKRPPQPRISPLHGPNQAPAHSPLAPPTAPAPPAATHFGS